MIKYVDIKKSVNDKINKIFPEIPIYGKEKKEGFNKPCFFPYIIPRSRKYETVNFDNGGFTVKITYMQKTKDELDMLRVHDAIEDGFGMYLEVGNRKILVDEISFEYVGEKMDILQMSISYNFTENIHIDDTEEVAEEVDVVLKGE